MFDSTRHMKRQEAESLSMFFWNHHVFFTKLKAATVMLQLGKTKHKSWELLVILAGLGAPSFRPENNCDDFVVRYSCTINPKITVVFLEYYVVFHIFATRWQQLVPV